MHTTTEVCEQPLHPQNQYDMSFMYEYFQIQ